MADSERGLYINFISSEPTESIESMTPSRGGSSILCCRLVRATHNLGEEASKTEAD